MGSAKRVLYVDLSPSPGGSIISLHHLVRYLERARFEPVILLSTLNEFRGFDELGIAVYRVPTPHWEVRPRGMVDRLRSSAVASRVRQIAWGRRIAQGRHYGRQLLSGLPAVMAIIREVDPTLIHFNTGITLLRSSILAARILGKPTLCHVRTFSTPTAVDNRLLVPGLYQLVFISQAVAEAQLAAMDRPPSSLVIPNAVRLEDFSAPVDVPAMRSSLGVPTGVPLIGMLSRIAPWKGQHVFVEALARLSQHYPNVHGVIVGLAEEADGPGYAAQVRQQADDLGLNQRLIMAGFRDDVPQVLAALDALAHCSVKPEPFGRVIIEGMAAGCPVVGTAAGGVPEIISDGVDGYLVSPGDAAALAAALTSLLSDGEARSRLIAAAHQTVRQRYDVASHVAAVQTCYDKLLMKV
jgi:glycosyltransferase involved in cell wall biosynthesis